ncbi:hypothetical protein K438DRAFT_1985363 [Mycena galopus ATCC 62051]|nr:hypothetical protein K438DRAFT_1985363 [Mycena galopus ATCC 62051]
MSSSLKCPTSSRPAAIADSSDDEVQLAVQSSPRYDFCYPRLSTTALPAFEDHPFWKTAGTLFTGRTLATFALRIRTKGHGISRKTLTTALYRGLPYFRLAVSTLDASKLVPKDISLCLVGIFRLTQFANDQDEEWSEFVFPDYSDDPVPRLPLQQRSTALSSPRSHVGRTPGSAFPHEVDATAPSDLKMLTPHVEMKVEPPKDGAPPSKCARNTEVEPQPTLVVEAPTRKTRSNDKSTPAKITAVKTPAPEAPSKTVAKLLKTLPFIETRLREIGDSKHEIGWAAFPADDFIVTVAVSRKQGTAIPHARSHVGVTSTHRKSKATDYTMTPLEPMPLIELEAVHNLPVENAVEPLIGCTPCNLLRIKCQPNGVGVTCQSCSYKKMGAICDYTMDTAQFAALMHDLAEKPTFFFPTIPISIERLKHIADMVAAARKSFALVHGEFCLHLHTFICAIRNQGDVLGKEGFRTLFKDLKEDEDEDAVGELDLSSPKADPGGSLVPYDSDEEVEVDAQPPKKPVICVPTKSSQKPAPSTSG